MKQRHAASRAWIIAIAGLVLTIGVVGASAFAQSPGELPHSLTAPMVARDEPVTPTPTPTATPTPAATPTPPPAANEPYVQNTSSYVSSIGTLRVVGEVVNPLPYPVDFVRIDAAFYSSSGTLLATSFTFSDIHTIPASGDSPFALLLLDPPSGIASYELQVTNWDSDPLYPPATGLAAQITNSFTSGIGTVHDVGTVTNSGATAYEFVRATIAYYDAAGTVLRVAFTYISQDVLGPGQTASFEVLLLDGDEVPFASRRIWVDGRPTDAVPGGEPPYVQNVSSYTGSLGFLYVVGEVVNPLDHAIDFVRVEAEIYDAGGTLLATDFTYSDVSVIPAEGDSPFKVIVINPPADGVDIQLSVSSWFDEPLHPPLAGLEAVVTNSYIDGIGWRHDVGTVTNTSANTYEFVQVIIAYYDPSGTVVRVERDYIGPDTLGPGESAPFDVILFDPDEANIDTYRTWVDSRYE